MSELRASDADRERTAEALRQAAGEGRLTVHELDERLEEAFRPATTVTDLARLTEDVVAAPAAGARMPVRPGSQGTRRVVSIFGGSDRRGRWRLAARVRVVNVFGGADLDLNDAELDAPETTMSVFSMFGGADLYLPDHLNVEVSEFALFGGNSIRLGDADPDPGGPVLRLRIVSLFGGTDVRRGRKLSRRERRELKEARRRGLGA